MIKLRPILFLILSGTVLVLVGALVASAVRLTAYQRIFNFDIRADQPYPLTERAAAVAQVELDQAGFTWPVLPPGIDTVFLTVEIESTLRGRWNDPYLEYAANGHVARQYFGLNAAGIRHVDLTPLLRQGAVGPGQLVAIEVGGLRWRSLTATLSAFQGPSLAGARVLVLAPHPDDAELAAFGLYSETYSTILTTTAGDHGSQDFKALYPSDREQALVKGRLRVLDSVIAPNLGGVPPSRSWNLGYFDGTVEAMFEKRDEAVESRRGDITDIDFFRSFNLSKPPGEGAGAPRWSMYVSDIAAALDATDPDVIVLPHPFVDAHSDHRFTTIALCEALGAKPRPDATLFMYMNTGVYSGRFPHGPRTALTTLPPWFEDPFPFEGIYSHVLTEHAMGMKALALEAHHDMRGFDVQPTVPISTQVRGLGRSLWGRVTATEPPRPGDFRHKGRPNEIFFTLPAGDAGQLCEAFLDRWRKGDFRHYK